jgi:hypothetical protein
MHHQSQHTMRHSLSSSIRLPRPNRALQRTSAKRFSLMSDWFYIMIGFGRATQVQEGNQNVV